MAISTLSSISRAAFSVKVRAKISSGLASLERIKYFILSVMTVVFPVPAPAIIRRGPLPYFIAASCSLLSFMSDAILATRQLYQKQSSIMYNSPLPVMPVAFAYGDIALCRLKEEGSDGLSTAVSCQGPDRRVGSDYAGCRGFPSDGLGCA